ncbi:MAG: membrane protein [Chloroflexota bacterium]|nr:MAG: membrane protein [Chloroflexota bacterium]
MLVVTSDKFQFPSEEYFKELNNFFIEIQSEIDNAGVDQKVGTLEDYQIIPSEDGSTIMIQAPFVSRGLVSPLIHITEEFSGKDFNFYFIGTATIEHTFAELAERDLVTGETIGISVALIILALVFGSVTSAFIPVIMAIVAIFVSIGMVSVVGQIVDLNDFVTNIMTMMGLAVGIDYCLFILSRYREERDSGFDKVQAIANTGSTAGRAVMFSGFTVVFAILGVFIIPEKTFHAFGVGTVLVVFVAVLAGITLLPAIIGLLGDKVNSFEVPKILTLSLYFIGFFIVVFTVGLGPVLLIVSGIVLLLLIIISIIKKKPSSGVTNPDSDNNQGGFWNTITLQVMKRPYVSMIIASGILIFLSYFYFDLEEGTSGISVLPDEEPVKIGFELLNEKFGFGQDAPTLIAVDADTSSEKISQSLTNLEKGISDYSGMNPPQLTIYDEVSYAEFLASIPGDPNGQDAVNSIKYLRNTLIPNAFEGVDPKEYTIYVGGSTAEIVDSVESVNESFPYVIGLVLLLSLLLLLFAFRSVTIPIASIVMNLLSVGASYGLLVLVFQKGFMIDIFGFEQVDQIEFWLPLFMFTILFGLSMDYHVFMLSRIKENFDETKSANESVAFGLRTTASIITGAALIMVAVFGGFALGDITFFQSMGFGLGAAVLIDATIVRSILVPSVMKILGESAWYLPSWLNWLPNISIEGNVKN